MERLYEKFRNQLKGISLGFTRSIMDRINWEGRLICIRGARGVGKTTLAGVMARVLAERGYKILAIDADPDSNLASAIGIDQEKLHSTKPLALMTEFIEERTSAKKGAYGSFFKLNPRVDDIPDTLALCWPALAGQFHRCHPCRAGECYR